MTFGRKLVVGLVTSAVVVGLLFLLFFFLFWSDATRPDVGDVGDEERNSVELVDVQTVDSAATEQEKTEEAATEQEKTPVQDERKPLLMGRVFGELGEIPGAHVLLFSLSNIEGVIRRLENFDPGAGLPDIPRIITAIKGELTQFRDAGIEAVSDAEGIYAFYDDTPATAYFVLVVADGHVFRYGDVVRLFKEQTQELDLEMDRGATIAGRVVDAGENPMPGVIITAEYRPPGMQGVGKIVQKLLGYVNGEFLKGPFQTTTDDEGRFTIDSLPPAVYDLLAQTERFPETRLEAVATGTMAVVILLQPGTRVEGMLVDNANLPTPDLKITLVPQLQMAALPFPGVSDIVETVSRIVGEDRLVTRSGKNGSFLFPSVGGGRYKLEIKETEYLPVERHIEVIAGERLLHLGSVRVDSGGVITGWIRGPGGAAVGNGTVAVFPEKIDFMSMAGPMNDMLSGRTRIDADTTGFFRVSGLTSGTYRVFAQAQGFGGASRDGITTGGEPITITIEPGVTIAGNVIDATTEEPLAGVRVAASGVFSTTDADGVFVLEGVAPRNQDMDPFGGMGRNRWRRRTSAESSEKATADDGEEPSRESSVEVRASAKGYQDERESVVVAEIPEKLVIAIEKKSVIHGIALDPDGKPLAGTLVRLVPRGAGEIPFIGEGMIFLDVTVSNLEGEFALDAPSDDAEFLAMGTHPLYATVSSEPFRAADLEEDDTIEIRLVPGGTVRGTVTDGAHPIPGAIVRLAKFREIPMQQRFIMNMLGLPKEGDVAYTDAGGTFEYEGLKPGDYVLGAEIAGFGDTRTEKITLAAGEEREVNVVMDPGGAVTGNVVDQAGVPLAGVRVRVLKEAGDEDMRRAQGMFGGSFKRAMANEEGQFTLAGLPSATYTVIAEKRGFTPASATGIWPGEDPLDLKLVEAARVDGRIFDAITGLPVPQFEFRILSLDDDGDDGFQRFIKRAWKETRNSEGRFFRDKLAAGQYRVEARADTFAPVSTDIYLAAGDVKDLEFAMERAGVLLGTVVDAHNGQLIAGVRVALGRTVEETPQDDGPRRTMRRYFEEVTLGKAVFTEDDGSFALDGLPADAPTVIFTHDDYVQEFRDNLDVPFGQSKEIKVVLERGLSISGKIASATGTFAGFVLVGGVSENVKRIEKSTQTDSTGAFKISGLQSGTYRLMVSSRGRRGRQSVPSRVEVVLDENDIEDLVINAPQ